MIEFGREEVEFLGKNMLKRRMSRNNEREIRKKYKETMIAIQN